MEQQLHDEDTAPSSLSKNIEQSHELVDSKLEKEQPETKDNQRDRKSVV